MISETQVASGGPKTAHSKNGSLTEVGKVVQKRPLLIAGSKPFPRKDSNPNRDTEKPTLGARGLRNETFSWS